MLIIFTCTSNSSVLLALHSHTTPRLKYRAHASFNLLNIHEFLSQYIQPISLIQKNGEKHFNMEWGELDRSPILQ